MAKILIVEDSPTQVAALTILLEKCGHQPLVAVDGDQGVAMAIEHQPDLVLMDVLMPALNGFQATRKLHAGEQTKHIPIVILTTKNTEVDKMWGLRQGAAAYMTKPFSEDELASTVASLLDSKTEAGTTR